ncbi:MAG: hypothetical protein COY38_01610 [Candidatus Aenigmarchaeota archaeon CG_4_10_14_0_8_um_filter_37_24]|nr:hypothetical protein [Candidatus Aenigmarchaeota archaeon]OIN88682.1 MAG: hypothetical protein AUJ50_00215 [Candidatus Aenigmarchaeota archaeon CG1_02_38_14]PIV68056.1 MAG: hypothetical protein COS07_05320 [Candidatus Aenigmarchaeota archaeon CG01_land_8_20_14_3_00_37_9]PIW41284.1 MAG: hypothetical protein COW21_02780 [Candidatus Aenigmarchaeota archaeon CG15_BIG_FIL_POST_REV_8_21_14_020_37_27]PIX50589.1 MAG: hypothetical protein COZ52_03170 [Candidatus Aenigmarchaeota archaeon CG_4_8_14_3_u
MTDTDCGWPDPIPDVERNLLIQVYGGDIERAQRFAWRVAEKVPYCSGNAQETIQRAFKKCWRFSLYEAVAYPFNDKGDN